MQQNKKKQTHKNKQQSKKRPSNQSKQKFTVMALGLSIIVVGILFWVVFYYTTQLSLVLEGEKNVKVGLNAVYEDPGVKGRISGKEANDCVKVTGTVDTSVPGTYTLVYKAKLLTIKRTVTVLDKMNPELVLKEAKNLQKVKLGEKFEEPGYTATDEEGKDITDQVVVSGLDFKKAGKQTIKYTVSDSKGKKTMVKRQVKVVPNTDYEAMGIPICMYHYVYDENNPPDDLNERFGNYISTQDLEEELNWLNDEGYYYPTWKEVRAYVDGKLILPEKSIVICFDDGALSFLDNGIPVLEKCKVPATCFMITSSDGPTKIDKYKSKYVHYESHSHNMHRPGGYIGHGGIFTAIDEDEGIADLEKSIEICGSSDAFAYPYGDYNDRSEEMVKEAGFLCAMTTQPGKAYPGDDPLLLPRVRMVMGQSLESFKSSVEP